MQKILLILCAILTTTSANATQMCARRDTTVIPLDSIPAGINVNGKAYGDDPIEWIWWSNFEYGRIYGVATCLSLADLREIEGNQELSSYLSSLSTDEDAIQGRSDYYNGDTTNPEYERKFCYCKLTHPMSSRWLVFQYPYSVANCPSFCAGGCALNAAGSDVAWRSALFNTIGYGYESIDTNEYGTSISLN